MSGPVDDAPLPSGEIKYEFYLMNLRLQFELSFWETIAAWAVTWVEEVGPHNDLYHTVWGYDEESAAVVKWNTQEINRAARAVDRLKKLLQDLYPTTETIPDMQRFCLTYATERFNGAAIDSVDHEKWRSVLSQYNHTIDLFLGDIKKKAFDLAHRVSSIPAWNYRCRLWKANSKPGAWMGKDKSQARGRKPVKVVGPLDKLYGNPNELSGQEEESEAGQLEQDMRVVVKRAIASMDQWIKTNNIRTPYTFYCK